MTFFRGVATDLRPNTPIYVVGFEAKPSHDALQAAALYRGRLVWFDHHDWPPEDLHAMRQALGANVVHVTPGTESSLPAVLALCGRRSRFSDKLVDLVTGRFTQHDWERWGRLWWHRLGELGKRPGEHRADLDAAARRPPLGPRARGVARAGAAAARRGRVRGVAGLPAGPLRRLRDGGERRAGGARRPAQRAHPARALRRGPLAGAERGLGDLSCSAPTR